MLRRERYVPRHLAARRPHRRLVTPVAVAMVATGVVVGSGVVGGLPGPSVEAAAATAVPDTGAPAVRTADPVTLDLGDRARVVSRSLERTAVQRTKARALDQSSGGQVTATEDLTTGDPRDIARAMLGSYGFGADQFSCLDSIYVNESGWDVHADNPSSSAYGIPQALPG